MSTGSDKHLGRNILRVAAVLFLLCFVGRIAWEVVPVLWTGLLVPWLYSLVHAPILSLSWVVFVCLIVLTLAGLCMRLCDLYRWARNRF